MSASTRHLMHAVTSAGALATLLMCASLWASSGVVASLASANAAAATPATARVSATIANVRASATPSAAIAFQIKRGAEVTVIETAGNWYLIEHEGRRGYIYRSLLDMVQATAPPPLPAEARPTAPAAATAAAPVTIGHSDIACVVAETYPKLDACFTPEANVGRAQIHFRAAETEQWFAVDMQREGGCYSTFLPQPLRTTTGLEYYVAVMDRSFTEARKPEGAPADFYRVTVEKRERECAALARVPPFVRKLPRPLVVLAAQVGPTNLAAGTAGGTGLALLGFSGHGLIMAGEATVAAAGASGAAAAAGSGAAGSGGGGVGAGAGVGATSGGGIGTTTLAVAAGGALAVAGTAAVVTGGSSANCPSASELASSSNGAVVSVEKNLLCSEFITYTQICEGGIRWCIRDWCSTKGSIYWQARSGTVWACQADFTNPEEASSVALQACVARMTEAMAAICY